MQNYIEFTFHPRVAAMLAQALRSGQYKQALFSEKKVIVDVCRYCLTGLASELFHQETGLGEWKVKPKMPKPWNIGSLAVDYIFEVPEHITAGWFETGLHNAVAYWMMYGEAPPKDYFWGKFVGVVTFQNFTVEGAEYIHLHLANDDGIPFEDLATLIDQWPRTEVQ